RIQNIRKSRGYNITDRIEVIIAPGEPTDSAVAAFSDYISRQVLASSLLVAPVENPADDEVLDIDGNQVVISVKPV
ncbi:MAG: hypothetical protein K2O33_02100, partial [Muribaculaceae bacterium]|nr:hypothetical protein [Muribaculaceae bacterium]